MTEIQPATAPDARRLTDRIKAGVEAIWHLITEAYLTRAWAALGYASWDEYCVSEFGTSRISLPREDRREIVGSLREAGLSTRAIAAATGVSEPTVRRDLESPGASFSGGNDAPATRVVTGVDGKVYKPKPQAQQLVSSAQPEACAHSEPVEASRLPAPAPSPPAPTPPRPEPVTLTLRTHKGDAIPYPKPQAPATFNQSDGEGISWAAWSWNPVTGCLHGCDYCYARAIATRFPAGFPAGFTPLFHHERLDAPANTTIPAAHRDDSHESCTDGDCHICAWRRVFVCSMADLYGRWVPDEWIDQVHASMLASPAWQYILLTKFPSRYVGLDLPPQAWVGTSVDTQARVRIAEDAMRQLDGGAVRWLSLEPLREPLLFTDLSVFDWVVIGAQTETRQPSGTVPAFAPEFAWVARVYLQAIEAGCQVHFKPNLQNGRPGMRMPNEYPLMPRAGAR